MLQIAPARTLAEIAMVMASLPPEDQCKVMADRSRAHDANWLDAVSCYGGFDLTNDLGYERGSLSEVPYLIEAAVAFLEKDASRHENWDPLCGIMKNLVKVRVLGAPEAFKQAFSRLVDRFVEQEDQRSGQEISGGQRPMNALNVEFAHSLLISGAVALDLPDAVGKLDRSCPSCALSSIKEGLRGEPLAEDQGKFITYTPYGLALSLGRLECMEAIARNHPQDRLPIGAEFSYDDDSGIESSPIWLLLEASLPHDDLMPGAYATALGHALGRPMSEADRKAHFHVALEAMNDSGSGRLGIDAVTGCLLAGIYDVDSAVSVTRAIEHGHEAVIRHFKGRIPWDSLPFDQAQGDSPMVNCLVRARMSDRAADYEGAMLAIMDMAKEDGQLERVMHSFVTPLYRDGAVKPIKNAAGDVVNLTNPDNRCDSFGPVLVEPLFGIITMRFDRVLARELERGLNPNEPMSQWPGSWTPLQVADESFSETPARIMRDHQMRGKSLALTIDYSKDQSQASLWP